MTSEVIKSGTENRRFSVALFKVTRKRNYLLFLPQVPPPPM